MADSSPIDLFAMSALIGEQPDFEVVATASTAGELLERAGKVRFEVAVISPNLDTGSSVPAVAFLLDARPQLNIVVLSDRERKHCVVLNPPIGHDAPMLDQVLCGYGRDCLALAAAQGARATVRRDSGPEALFRAIRGAAYGIEHHEGGPPFGPEAKRKLVRAPLTRREFDVAELIGRGLSNKEIAHRLELSEPTVKKHVGRVLEKLGVEDRLQAGVLIARHPLLFQRRLLTSR